MDDALVNQVNVITKHYKLTFDVNYKCYSSLCSSSLNFQSKLVRILVNVLHAISLSISLGLPKGRLLSFGEVVFDGLAFIGAFSWLVGKLSLFPSEQA